MTLTDSSRNHFQSNFTIDGLIHENVRIKKKIWLQRGKVFLQKTDKDLNVCVLEYLTDDDIMKRNDNELVVSFVRFSSLLSNDPASLKNRGGSGLRSKKEFGKKIRHLQAKGYEVWPERQVKEAERTVPVFIKQIKFIRDKYAQIIKENAHLEIALVCLHDSNVKSYFSNEGFLNVTIGMEALYSENSSDISYKLAHRAAFLLGLIYKSPLVSYTIFENIKKAYSERSRIVHGKVAQNDVHLRETMFSYLKLSLIIMIILYRSKNPKQQSSRKNRGGTRKERALNKIDLAMLNPLERQKLISEIKRFWKDFQPLTSGKLEWNEGKHRFRTYAW